MTGTLNITKSGGQAGDATVSSGEIRLSVLKLHRGINAVCESVFAKLATLCGNLLTGAAIPFIVLLKLQKTLVKDIRTQTIDL
jgi:hypothetical protein